MNGTVDGTRTKTLKELNRILAGALKELAKAGEAGKERACEMAAQAWVLLREVEPREAERMNALLHRLTGAQCSCHRAAAGESGSGAASAVASSLASDLPSDSDLDVRHLPPARRHELIFEAFRRLEAGQGFILINDHDPKPLYYQLAFEHPGDFTWTPLESGPEVWRVRIGRP